MKQAFVVVVLLVVAAAAFGADTLAVADLQVSSDRLPLVVEATVTSAFLERRLFLVTKALSDVDLNFTSRYQPGRVLPGYGKQENFVLIGLSKSDTISCLSR